MVLMQEQILSLPKYTYNTHIGRLANVLDNLFNINYFTYLRLHKDHGMLMLDNYDFAYDLKYYQSNHCLIDAQYFACNAIGSSLFIYDSEIQTKEERELFETASKVYNLPSGVLLTDYHSEYIDSFHFASNKFENDRISPIIKQLDSLNKFKQFFLQETKNIINNSENYLLYSNHDSLINKFHDYAPINIKQLDNIKSYDPLTQKFIREKLYASYLTKLTPMEIQCIHWKYHGKSAKEIAKALNASYRTIEKHLELVRRKFKCKKTSEAIYKAKQIGII
jgi:DNA-binding CsgD family transcriptional regulator